MKTSEMLNVGAGFHPCPEKGKNVNGITLVALIITIIVMLILVGVSVQVIIDSNLIETAQDAADRTETAYGEEGNIGQITVGNTTYSSIEDYLENEKKLPEFVDSIEQCTDTSKKYVLPDGHLYEYKKTTTPNFTNLADVTSESWLNDTRLSTSATSTLSGIITTNYIPCVLNDVIRVKGLNVLSSSIPSYSKTRYHLLDSTKTLVVSDCGYLSNIQGDNKVINEGDITTIIAGYTKADLITLREWSKTRFIRLCGELMNGYSSEDIIITVNEEITYSTNGNSTWQKSELYVPSEWTEEVKTVASKVLSIKTVTESDVTQFLLTSDLHFPNQSNIQNIGKVSAEVMRVCDIPFFMNLGDNNPDGFDNIDMPDYASYMNDILDVLAPINQNNILVTVGNHDGTSGLKEVDGEIIHYGYDLNNEDRASVYFGWQKANANKKFGPDGTYYYIDDTNTKTRYIMLNSFWNKHLADEYGRTIDMQHSYMYTPMFGESQMIWFINEALNMPDGYSAIIGTHGATPDYGAQKDLEVFKNIIAAYVNKSEYAGSFTGDASWQSYSITVDFTNANGELIAIFHGHEHKDDIDTTTYAVPFIGITSASAGARDENAPTRTVGTATETAIDVVTIDKTNKKIHITRLGVGNDRVIEY